MASLSTGWELDLAAILSARPIWGVPRGAGKNRLALGPLFSLAPFVPPALIFENIFFSGRRRTTAMALHSMLNSPSLVHPAAHCRTLPAVAPLQRQPWNIRPASILSHLRTRQ